MKHETTQQNIRIRLTGIVKAKVCRFDGDLMMWRDTDKEVEIYLDEIANVTGVADTNGRLIEREC